MGAVRSTRPRRALDRASARASDASPALRPVTAGGKAGRPGREVDARSLHPPGGDAHLLGMPAADEESDEAGGQMDNAGTTSCGRCRVPLRTWALSINVIPVR